MAKRTKPFHQGTLLHCAFCNKSQRDVRKLIAGSSVCICNECVMLCYEILQEDSQTTQAQPATDQPTE